MYSFPKKPKINYITKILSSTAATPHRRLHIGGIGRDTLAVFLEWELRLVNVRTHAMISLYVWKRNALCSSMFVRLLSTGTTMTSRYTSTFSSSVKS